MSGGEDYKEIDIAWSRRIEIDIAWSRRIKVQRLLDEKVGNGKWSFASSPVPLAETPVISGVATGPLLMVQLYGVADDGPKACLIILPPDVDVEGEPPGKVDLAELERAIDRVAQTGE